MKDRDNGKGKVWEKNRRDRLKDSFHKLGQLLPHYDPAKIIPQQEILDKATQFVKELRLSNSRLLTQQTQADEKSKLIQELQDEVNKLILRVKQLTMLLNEANITIPAGPSLKLLGKRKLKFSDKLVAADDIESPAKRKTTNEDIETTKENEKESSSQSDVSNNVNGTASTPLRETNGCAVTQISTVAATTTTSASGGKESHGETFVSNEISSTSTTISIPVSVPLQISPNAPPPIQSSVAPIQATLKPLTFTIQNTPTTTIFLTPHSLTPISTMVTPIATRINMPPHRILPKPNDPSNLLAKIPIVRVRQPIPVVKKKRRRRGKNSANDDNSTTAKTTTDNKPPQNEDSFVTISTELSEFSQLQSDSNSNTITLISETLTVEDVEMTTKQPTPPHSPVSLTIPSSSSNMTIDTERLPDTTELTSQNVNVKVSEKNLNLDADHHQQLNENDSKVEKVAAAVSANNDHNNKDSGIVEQEASPPLDTKELEKSSNANDLISSTETEAEEKNEATSVMNETVIESTKPATIEDPLPSDDANNTINDVHDSESMAGKEIVAPCTSSEIIQTPSSAASSITTTSVENSNGVKSNAVGNSQSCVNTGKACVLESSEKPLPDLPPPPVSDTYLEMKKPSDSSSIMTEDSTATNDDESSLVGPQPATHPVAVTNEIEMTNSHSLQEIVDNLMEAPTQISNQRLQLEDQNNEELTLSSNNVGISPPIEQQPEEGGSVSNEKISECIARSIDLELSGDWGETGSDVNSPNPPISPTQMFLSMFPLLPRDSIIISNETTQNTQPSQQQQQGHKQQQQNAAVNFTSVVKSSSSSFYIDSMLPDTEDHFHRNSSIPVSVSNNSAALISSNNSNCQDINSYHNIINTSNNLLSLASTPTQTETLKSTGTTCLAMIPPISNKRKVIDNTENSENHLHPFSFHFPPTSNLTTASTMVSSSSGNKNADNCSNSALKNHNVQQQPQPCGLNDSDTRNLHLTLNLHPPDSSNRERMTDLDSSFPIFSSSFMNNLTHHNSGLSCSKTTSNICSLNNNNNTDSANNNQRHRKEPEIGHWTPYEYPSYSMASIRNKNTTDTSSINNFLPSSSSLTTVRHSSNSTSNMNNDQNKQQNHNHHQQQQQQLFLFDTPSSNSTSSNIKSVSSNSNNNNNKVYSSSEYVNNNVPQKNSQHAGSTSAVSSMNTEQTVQNTNTHAYKPYMQNFHSQTQSHRQNNNGFSGGSNGQQQQQPQIVQHVESASSSLTPTLSNMYGGSSVTEYHNNNNKNQEQQQQQQLDLFRPLSVPTSTDFLHHHHHSQHNLQQKQQSSNNNQTYSQQHNVLRGTGLNISLSSNNSSTAASTVNSSHHQPKTQHTSKAQHSRNSSSSRSQAERNNNNSATKAVPSFSSHSNSTSRSSKSTSSIPPLHSPYSSQVPIISNTSTNISLEQREHQYRQLPQPVPEKLSSSSNNGSSGRSGTTKNSSSNQSSVQHCSRSASSSSSSSNSKRNYHRVQQSQSQPQHASLTLSNQNPVSSSLDFPPPPPPPAPSSTNFVMGNNFYENILPSGGHAQFSIDHHHHSKTQASSSSSRHQPFYLPEVPVQNFDFMHPHHQPPTIGGPVNSSSVVPITVPPLPLPPPPPPPPSSSSTAAAAASGPTISSQQTQKHTLSSIQRSSQSTIHNTTNTNENNKGTTPYSYFSGPCHPVRGYSAAATSSSSSLLNSNNNKSDHNVMVSLTDAHSNNSAYGSSSNSSQSQQHLPVGQNQLTSTTAPAAAKNKSATQNQSQQVYSQANSHNSNTSSQHSHSSHHQSQPPQQQRQQHPHGVNNLSQSVPSNRPVNWMTDPFPPQAPPLSSSCNRKTGGDNSSSASSSSIPNPFSVSKLVGNTNSSSGSNNNHSSSGNNNNNNNNYCVEGLIRKPISSSSSDWNDFHLTSSSSSSGHANIQSMTSHPQPPPPPPFVPYQAQPDYGNYANFPHHSHSHHHYTNTVAVNPPAHFVHHFDHSAVHVNPGPPSSTGGHGHNLHVQQQQQQQQQQHHSHHPGNNSLHQGIPESNNSTNATISSHSLHSQGHHQGHHHQQQQQQHGTSSVLNFNLSSIFPEMNDKRNTSSNSNNNNNVCNYYPTSSTGGNGSNK